MTIRTALPGDAAEWARMRTALWPESPADHAPEIEQYFSAQDGTVKTFVVDREDGGLCGFLEAGTRPYAEGCLSSPVAYIEGWWVDEDLQNDISQAAHRALGYEEQQRIVCFRKSL